MTTDETQTKKLVVWPMSRVKSVIMNNMLNSGITGVGLLCTYLHIYWLCCSVDIHCDTSSNGHQRN